MMTVEAPGRSNGLQEPESPVYFVWRRNSLEQTSDEVCDICTQDDFPHEAAVKVHQLQKHINPSYLSPADREIAKVHNLRVKGDFRPCSDTWTGLYRCHFCFVVFDLRDELKVHLSEHASRPEDFGEDELLSTKAAERRKARIAFSAGEGKRKRISSPADDSVVRRKKPKRKEESESESTTSSEVALHRPERKCKDNAKALVAISLQDENEKIDFEKFAEQVKEKIPPAKEVPQAAKPKEAESDDVGRQREQEGEKGQERLQREPTTPSKRKRGRPKKTVDEVVAEAASTAKKTQKKVVPAAKTTKKKRRRKKRLLLSKKKKSSQKQKTETQTGKKSKNSASVVSTIEDFLTLAESPKKVNKSEKEKADQFARDATNPVAAFICFECNQQFPSFLPFSAHKKDCGTDSSSSSKLLRSKSEKGGQQQAGQMIEVAKEESEFIAGSIRRVPETTFNSYHGRYTHIGSQSPSQQRHLDAIERVKLNLSGSWTADDVWESGGAGWERPKNPLTWRKYQNGQDAEQAAKFLHKMSGFSWAEQETFKRVMDKNCSSNHKKPSLSEAKKPPPLTSSRNLLPWALGLKQKSKSIKYMSALERAKRESQLSLPPAEDVYRIIGDFNGEYETEHRHFCCCCGEEFDELREVMHHKWDAHPFCLVAHVSIRPEIILPSATMTHPQIANGVPETDSTVEVKAASKGACTNCIASDNQLTDEENFHKHVLECGGDLNWDAALHKKKKKKRIRTPRKLDEAAAEAAAAKRKARFARFDLAPPTVEVTGRMTRLQANMMKETIKQKRRKKKQQKVAASKVSRSRMPMRSRRSGVSYSREVWHLNTDNVEENSSTAEKTEEMPKVEPQEPPSAAEVKTEEKKTLTTPKKSPAKRRASADDDNSPKAASSSFVRAKRLSLDESKLTTDDGETKPDMPKKRSIRRNSLFLLAAAESRLIFPAEVKAEAVARIEAGESTKTVAKNLDCPVSTVSSWVSKLKKKLNRSTSPAIDAVENGDKATPFERKDVLKSMKMAFKAEKEDLVNGHNEGEKEESERMTLTDNNKKPKAEVTIEENNKTENEKVPKVEENSINNPRPESSASSTSGLSMIFQNYNDDDEEEDA